MGTKNDMSEGVKALFQKKETTRPASQQQANRRQTESQNTTSRGLVPAPSSSKNVRHVKDASRGEDISTSIRFNLEQYNEIRRISYDENIPIREVMYQMLQSGLEAYKKGKINFDYFRQSLGF